MFCAIQCTPELLQCDSVYHWPVSSLPVIIGYYFNPFWPSSGCKTLRFLVWHCLGIFHDGNCLDSLKVLFCYCTTGALQNSWSIAFHRNTYIYTSQYRHISQNSQWTKDNHFHQNLSVKSMYSDSRVYGNTYWIKPDGASTPSTKCVRLSLQKHLTTELADIHSHQNVINEITGPIYGIFSNTECK